MLHMVAFNQTKDIFGMLVVCYNHDIVQWWLKLSVGCLIVGTQIIQATDPVTANHNHSLIPISHHFPHK